MRIGMIGKASIVFGVTIMIYALNMSVSIDGANVVNIDMLSQRQNTLLLGGIVFIAGIALFAVHKVKQTREEEAQETLDDAVKRKQLLDTIQRNGASASVAAYRAPGQLFGRILNLFSFDTDLRPARVRAALYVGACFSALCSLFAIGWLAFLGFLPAFLLAFLASPALPTIRRLHIINAVVTGLPASIAVFSIPQLLNSVNGSSSLAVLMVLTSVLMFTPCLISILCIRHVNKRIRQA